MYTLAFSPCPNDTFIFDALVNGKIDTEGLKFDIKLEDVQTLNNWALQGKMDFTKISYGVYPFIANQYKILNSGSALGKGVGPLLISQQPNILNLTNDIEVAIPGKNTTAHLLFSLAYPNHINKIFMVFNQIENYVLKDKNALGVIIHENRFTYQKKGLHKIVDLGEYWEQTTQLPIPLGGIVANKKNDETIIKQVDKLIKKSIEYAFKNYPIIPDYVKAYSQEMEESVMQQHINLYVNDFSISLANKGKEAIMQLITVYKKLYPNLKLGNENWFVTI